MRIKSKPQPRATAAAAGVVVGGRRDDPQTISQRSINQASPDREIYSGRDCLGLVRETTEGAFIAVIGEHVVGWFDTMHDATDKVIELARPEGGK